MNIVFCITFKVMKYLKIGKKYEYIDSLRNNNKHIRKGERNYFAKRKCLKKKNIVTIFYG